MAEKKLDTFTIEEYLILEDQADIKRDVYIQMLVVIRVLKNKSACKK